MKKKIITVLIIMLSFSFFSLTTKIEVKANGVPYSTYTYSSSSKNFLGACFRGVSISKPLSSAKALNIW